MSDLKDNRPWMRRHWLPLQQFRVETGRQLQTGRRSLIRGERNPGTGNNYLDSPNNEIDHKNVTLVKYDNTTGGFTTSGVNITNANGARVALENKNPHGGTAGGAINSPLFLTPLLNLFGQTTETTANVSVSAVAVNQALPGLPIVVVQGLCGKSGDVALDFQSGGKSTGGWETYQIENASTTEVRDLFEKLPYCAGQPSIDVGYCGNVANGVNATVFNAHIKPMVRSRSLTLLFDSSDTKWG